METVKQLSINLVSMGSFLALVICPLLIPEPYYFFLSIMLSIVFVIAWTHCFRFIYACYKVLECLGHEYLESFNLIHVIVIPNFEEPISVLRQTIDNLSKHTKAKTNYILVLAMEEAEKGSAGKGHCLRSEFQSMFSNIIITLHPKITGECRGKGSNVSWATKNFDFYCTKSNIDTKSMLFTIIDADAIIPELYFHEIERNSNKFGSRIFMPPILFARNSSSVPVFVRVVDNAWAVAVMQNLSDVKNISFPCSVYSIPLSMAKKVGWWDVGEEAIGEDLHMFLKCFYLSDTEFRSTPIWVPINVANVQDKDYFSSLYAKFIQAKRHLAGCCDSLFAFRHTFGNKTNFLSRLWCFAHVLEAHLIPATTCFIVFSVPVSTYIGSFEDSVFCHYLQTISFLISIPYGITATLHEFYRAKVISSKIYDEKVPHSWIGLLENVVAPICTIFFVSLPAACHSTNAFRVLMGWTPKEFVYVVAEKQSLCHSHNTSVSSVDTLIPDSISSESEIEDLRDVRYLKERNFRIRAFEKGQPL